MRRHDLINDVPKIENHIKKIILNIKKRKK